MRNYHLADTGVKYVKQRTYKNHSKTHFNETMHGGFECKFTAVKYILGWVWKRYGVRVLR